jgi:hypothetical protein
MTNLNIENNFWIKIKSISLYARDCQELKAFIKIEPEFSDNNSQQESWNNLVSENVIAGQTGNIFC